jgi:hypothetical protein
MTASANVNLVRSIAAEWERGDWFGPVMRTHAHPEIEFVRVGEGPDTGVGGRGSWTGAAEARRSWSDYLSLYADWGRRPLKTVRSWPQDTSERAPTARPRSLRQHRTSRPSSHRRETDRSRNYSVPDVLGTSGFAARYSRLMFVFSRRFLQMPAENRAAVCLGRVFLEAKVPAAPVHLCNGFARASAKARNEMLAPGGPGRGSVKRPRCP